MKTMKKYILIMIIIFVLNLLSCSGKTKVSEVPNNKDGDNTTFFIATDIHFLAKGLTDGGEAFRKFFSTGDGKQLDYVDEIMDAFVYDIKKERPDVLILSGDLTTNGERESHLELSKKLKSIEEAGTSVYVIPGNHDILNPWARGFKGSIQYVTGSVSSKDFSEIYGDFGYNEAALRDESSLSYLVKPSKDVWLLMLDTARYGSNEMLGYPEADGMIGSETLKWIKGCADLAKQNNARIVAVMHHNLLEHSETVREGFTLNNGKEVEEVFQNYGIDLVLSGHTHIQDIKSDKYDGSTIYDVVTGSISIYPQKNGVLKYSRGSGFDYTTSLVDVEGWAKEIGLTDKNLIDFNNYSRSFFEKLTYDMAYKRLSMIDDYSDDEKRLMVETLKTIKTGYYEGVPSIGSDIINSPGFKLWESNDKLPMQNWVMDMAHTDNRANNILHIP